MIIDWNCEEAKGKNYCSIHRVTDTRVFQKLAIGPTNATMWTLHKRPKAEQMKETFYTKEMHEAGELPRAGMTLLYRDIENVCVAVTKRDSHVILTLVSKSTTAVDAVYFQFDNSNIKPIDTRTDKEKAIESVVKTLSLNGSNKYALAQVIINGLEEDKIITFTGDK